MFPVKIGCSSFPAGWVPLDEMEIVRRCRYSFVLKGCNLKMLETSYCVTVQKPGIGVQTNGNVATTWVT